MAAVHRLSRCARAVLSALVAPGPERSLVLCDRTLACGSTLEFIDIAADLGFAGVTLRVTPSDPGRGWFEPGSADLRQAAATLRERGLAVSAVETVFLTDESATAQFLPLLDGAAQLGAQCVLVISEVTDPAMAVGKYAELAQAARARGLRLVLEYMVYRPARSLEAAVALVRAADPAGAGVVVDALHFTRAGDDPAALQAHAGAIGAFQLCDGPGLAPPLGQLKHEALFDRLPPGEGEFALPAMLHALPEHLPLCLEVINPAREAAAGPREWARQCRDGARALLADLAANSAPHP